MFLEAYFPGPRNADRLPTEPSPGVSGTWLKTIYTMSVTDSVLSDALSALSLAYMEAQDDPNLESYRSKAMYGRAMRALSRKLCNGDEMMQDTTLAATIALSAYETRNGTKAGVPGWLSHVKGTSTLIKLRGKRNVANEFAQQLFLTSRLADLINTIGKRKAIEPLASSFPNAFTGPLSSYAKLFEILQDIPLILEQADNIVQSLQNGVNDLASQVSSMSYTCQDYEARLLSWRAQLDREIGTGGERQLLWEEPSLLYHKLPIDSPARIFPTFFCFPNLDIAQQVVLYWTGLVFMQKHQHNTEQRLLEYDANLPSLYSTDAEREAVHANCLEMAINITKALEYFVHPDTGLAALDFFGLPLNLAYGCLRAEGAEEILWFDVIFGRLTDMSPGFSALMQGMAKQGGGGKAFRQLILQQGQS